MLHYILVKWTEAQKEQEALAVFDGSYIHRKWKAGFGPYIQQKAIFDCEELL